MLTAIAVDSDKYERKLASDLSRGDIVPMEDVSTSRLSERQVNTIQRVSLSVGARMQIRYDDGSCDFFPTSQRVFYRTQP